MKKMLVALFSVMLLLFLAPFLFAGILNVGNLFGMGVACIFIIYTAFSEKVNEFIKQRLKKRCFKGVFIALSAFAIAFCLLFLGSLVRISLIDTNADSGDVTLVVLGCQVKGDKPSLMLSERLLAAEKYLSEHPEARCVVSGGRGEDEMISEAECMFNYLTAAGIDKERIFLEDRSTSTYENLSFSAEIIDEAGLSKKIGIVTNEFHEYRAGKLAKKQGLESFAVPAKTLFILRPTFSVREVFALWYEAVLRKSI